MKFSFHHHLESCPELLVVPVAVNGYDQALSRIVSSTGLPADLLRQDFKADPGELHVLYTAQGRISLLGLGSDPTFADILKAFRGFSYKFRQKLPKVIGFSLLHGNLAGQADIWIEAATNGLLLGTYQIGRYKSSHPESHPLSLPEAEIRVLVEEGLAETAQDAVRKGEAVATTQLSIFDLVNAPSNKKTPSDLADWAVQSGKKYGYRVDVMDKQAIKANGLHALLAVNRGSEYPPTFIVMEYQSKAVPARPLKKIGLVGKGITFDTGGLSIKPSSNMHLMKSDMGGAAAVFGTMELAAKLDLPIHLLGIVPATDNSVDAKAIKPSDVIDSYSGKTIEIIDTDAEGRLILADGLSYMVKNYQPDVLIDLATLTGSAVRTFGYHAAGLFSNNEQLAGQLYQASEKSGERVWQLPIWEVYKDDIKSDVADVRNYSGRPMAGAIGAAKFLEVFIDDHPAWAHLDIAGVAFSDTEFSTQKSATAFGVRLLTEFLRRLSREDAVSE